MRGCHHQMSCGKTERLIEQQLCLIDDFARNHTAVDESETESGFAIVKDETSRHEFVMNVSGGSIAHSAVDGNAEGGRNVTGCGSGLEDLVIRS